jgi:hypothetical protein
LISNVKNSSVIANFIFRGAGCVVRGNRARSEGETFHAHKFHADKGALSKKGMLHILISIKTK